MTIMNTKDQNKRQAIRLIHTLLQLRKGSEYDAMTAMRFFMETYGIYADWHVYSSVLDQMHTNGEATITQPGGMTRYMVN